MRKALTALFLAGVYFAVLAVQPVAAGERVPAREPQAPDRPQK